MPGSGNAARAVVDAGHTGAVLGLEYDSGRGLLFSTGEDGTVRIWDAASGALQRILEVTQLDTAAIAIDPQAPRLAVVVTDHTGAYFLSVWDWEAERQVYRVTLKEEPLFVRFSGGGSYLLYGESSWQGLKMLNASDGTAVSFHPEGFGIVGFASMPAGEKTLVTYLVSGRLLAWDMASGAQTLDLPSVPFLSDVRMSRDGRYLAGTTGKEIVVLDAATGAARARVAASNVLALDISPTADALAGAIQGQGGISSWAFNGSALLPVAGPSTTLRLPARVCYGTDALFVGDASGALVALPRGGAEARFGGSALAGVTGFAAVGASVALSAPSFVRVFQSDILDGAAAPTYITALLAANPFKAPTQLAALPDGRLLAWRTDAAGPGLAIIDTSQGGRVVSLPTGFRAPLADLQPVGSLVLGVETGGVVRLTDLATGASRFDMRIPGTGAAVSTGATEIVAGRMSPTGAYGSLVRIDTRTGETVAIRDGNMYTYALAWDPGDGHPALYTVGVDAAGATNLVRHDGPGLDRSTVLGSVAEEDLDVSAAVDAGTHRLYANLGLDRLRRR